MTLVGTVWAPIGPSPISLNNIPNNGLTSAIAVSPNDDDVIYQGTAGGGVWRTIDGGTTWRPLLDRQVAMGVGEPAALAIDHNDTSTIYIGTSARLTPQTQAGLFKSSDGGASCIRLGSGYPAGNVGDANQFVNQWINVIIVDPADSQTVYLSSSSGVFRSLDGGLNWTQGTNSFGDARSLVLDTTSAPGARILFAGINGRGVLQSTDGGQNWAPILTAATPAVAAALAGGAFSKVNVALAPPTAPPAAAGVEVLYASMAGFGGAPDPVGLFVSTDQGGTWTQQAAVGMPTNTQGGYSFFMGVDPASPGDGANDILYFGCVGQARSSDSGASFTALSGLHADTHAWAFVAQSGGPTVVYCGNDGGIFRSTDDGATWTPLNAGGLQTSLFYNIAIKPDAAASVTVGALQDNQTETTAGAAGLAWTGTNGGDGWDVAYDSGIDGQVYTTSGFWSPAPCTRVWRSTDDGQTWLEVTPWGTTSDAGCYLAPVATDPSTGGIVYVSGSQNLWQSQDGGGNWRIIGSFPGAGEISVAASDGNYVAVAVGNQVFVSTNALAATVGPPNGVTFADITRNLPGRNVQHAVFDPNDPTVVLAVLGGFDGGPGQTGHVFRTTTGGSAWTDISPPVDVPHGAIALDGADVPTTIYVGTDFGVLRSRDEGISWTVLDDIHFPRAPVTDLAFNPQARILRAATYGRGVFEFIQREGPVIAVNLENGLGFGTVCEEPVFLTLQIFNVGTEPLVIDSVQRLMGSAGFVVLPSPGTPLVVGPDEEVDFTIQFTPLTPGTQEIATIRISSNDPTAPDVDLTATGMGGTGVLELVYPDTGAFGDVCLGSFADEVLIAHNNGPCTLMIAGVSSSSPEFVAPGVNDFPLAVEPGDSMDLPIRFEPTSFGSKAAVITVLSDDPDGPAELTVSGEAPPPVAVLMIADAGDFGPVCVDDFVDRALTISNSGRCRLTVTGISSSSPEFIVPNVLSYPLVVGAGASVEVPIRFQPTSFGPKLAIITIVSDDPTSPATVDVAGFAPSGEILVTGSPHFGGVELGRCAQQTVSICNTGRCDLHVSRIALECLCHCEPARSHEDYGKQSAAYGEPSGGPKHTPGCTHFCLVNAPSAVVIRPGSCIGVVVEFRPTCACTECCVLLIDSDDPHSPKTTLPVTGHLRRTLSSAIKCWLGQEIRAMISGQPEC